MSNKIQVRRGTNAQRLLVTFDAGEPVYTTDTKRLYVGDGATAGGVSASVNADWNASSGPEQILNKPTSLTPSAHAASHASGASDAVKLDDLAAPDDNTDLNVSASKHGLAPKLSGNATEFLSGIGTWATPAGSGGGATLASDRVVDPTKAVASSDSRVRGLAQINYIVNSDAEVDADGWAAYADASGATPVDGTGGTPTTTWERSTSTPLRGAGSFLLTKDAADRRGEGASYDFTLAAGDAGKIIVITLTALGDAGYAAGDVKVFLYDITAGALITVSGISSIAAGHNSCRFIASANTAYRLILHVSTTSTTAYTLKVDDVCVGPAFIPPAVATGDWQSDGALTITAVTTNPTKGTIVRDRLLWRRMGDSALCWYRYGQTAAGGADGSGDYLFRLPSGLSFNASLVDYYTGAYAAGYCTGIGGGWFDGLTGVNYPGVCTAIPYDATTFRLLIRCDNGSNVVVNGFANSGSIMRLSGQCGFQIQFMAPISGWSGY